MKLFLLMRSRKGFTAEMDFLLTDVYYRCRYIDPQAAGLSKKLRWVRRIDHLANFIVYFEDFNYSSTKLINEDLKLKSCTINRWIIIETNTYKIMCCVMIYLIKTSCNTTVHSRIWYIRYSRPRKYIHGAILILQRRPTLCTRYKLLLGAKFS